MTEKSEEDITRGKRDGRKGEELESVKRSDPKKSRETRGDLDDLQAERGGLKVNDSDFKTK